MYLLDSNLFIEAKNTYYGFDIAPGFWNFLRIAHEAGLLASVPVVRNELLAQEDELAEWVDRLPKSFWVVESQSTVNAMRTLAAWTMRPINRLRQDARTDFLASADYRLIAEAMAGNHVVVTREKPAPASIKRIKIPDVCAENGVVVASPFDAFRSTGLALR